MLPHAAALCLIGAGVMVLLSACSFATPSRPVKRQHRSLPRATAVLRLLGAVLLPPLLSGCAILPSASTKMAHVVYLTLPGEQASRRLDQFRDNLRRAGWMEGQNLELESHISADPTDATLAQTP